MAPRRAPRQLGYRNIDDRYIKGRKLGKGQFGTTYLCTEVATGRRLACKCIPKRDLTTVSDCVMVLGEHGISQVLNLKGHPNIISMGDAFEDERYVYFLMELCEGGDLFDYIVANGPFTEKRAATLMKQMMGAIATCHSCGIVHRDLKVENLLFATKDEDSPLKVIDFGLAQFYYGDVFTDKVGSLRYMAPEVMEGQHGPEVDIWSAGVVLYIFLVGFMPFKDDSMEGLYDEILSGHALDFENMEAWRSISEGAKDLIEKMLEYYPNKRYSAREVLEHPWIKNNAL